MERLNYALICESASVTESGNANFLGVITSITEKKLPIARKELSIVFNFSPKEAKTYSLKIRVKKPSGVVVIDTKGSDIHVSEEEKQGVSIGHILNVQNVVFDEEGTHSIEFYLNEELVHTYYLNINIK